MEQFADWVEDNNNLPDYFIDITNERVINKDSVLYTKYVDIFNKAEELLANKPAGEQLSTEEVLNKRIEDLNKEREEKIQIEVEKLDSSIKEN